MRYASNHWVYGKICAALFARDELLVGGIATKPLAHDIGTSIIPVREALIQLATQGVIEWIPSKGFFVSTIRGDLFAAIFQHAYDVALDAPTQLTMDIPASPEKGGCHNALDTADGPSCLHRGHCEERHGALDSMLKQRFNGEVFDRNFMQYAKLALSSAQTEILQHIWVRTMQFRYYLYHNFDLYARSFDVLPAADETTSAHTFITNTLLRYSMIAPDVAERAAVKQCPSPFM